MIPSDWFELLNQSFFYRTIPELLLKMYMTIGQRLPLFLKQLFIVRIKNNPCRQSEKTPNRYR